MAEKITRRNPHTFHAKGNVVLEDGKSRTLYAKLTFSLKDAKVAIER